MALKIKEYEVFTKDGSDGIEAESIMDAIIKWVGLDSDNNTSDILGIIEISKRASWIRKSI